MHTAPQRQLSSPSLPGTLCCFLPPCKFGRLVPGPAVADPQVEVLADTAGVGCGGDVHANDGHYGQDRREQAEPHQEGHGPAEDRCGGAKGSKCCEGLVHTESGEDVQRGGGQQQGREDHQVARTLGDVLAEHRAGVADDPCGVESLEATSSQQSADEQHAEDLVELVGHWYSLGLDLSIGVCLAVGDRHKKFLYVSPTTNGNKATEKLLRYFGDNNLNKANSILA